MKPIHYLLICCLLGRALCGYSQGNTVGLKPKGESKFFFRELYIALNATNPIYDGLQPEIGAGIGLRGYFLNDTTKVNLTLGIEFNKSTIHIDDFDSGFGFSKKNTLVNIYAVSIPVSIQKCFGKQTKFFIETGLYIDFWTGTAKDVEVISTSDKIGTVNSIRDEKVSGNIFLGPSGGAGIKVPWKNRKLICRLDYRYGLMAAGGSTEGDFSNEFKNSQARMIVGIYF